MAVLQKTTTTQTTTTLKPTTLAMTRIATTEEKTVLNWKIVCWSLGSWAAVSFVVCVFWGLVTPEAIHMHEFLEQLLPAFKWLTWWGFLLGLVESFLYGFYVGLVFVPIHNFFTRRWGTPQ